ncbi:hypothetical protein P153DRAFT_363119 [Dothidotthia symphoricarpi CBS 119687]|uniref:DUF7704 domain-containing protein n=1 Tax=Dothidotthia symphoricarpi CBS 119687 TaxID=1392245 RepID=A0A6A6AT53_9PLEO|nr:uncharacterized protein P153DRAFT_363119 [Dothidotthia symphoricarpi CBS 119687]KAF2134134.1 hypothetical protein P153DRAFT_363119 [Dothidotthia symphoricarpi CBS 119687]
MTPPNIPFIYRLWHLYLEPIAAIGGTIRLIAAPATYFDFMPATAAYSPTSHIVYNQLAATYLLFAFNQAVVLRVARDLQVWKALILGMLLCDAVHIYANWAEMGTQLMLNPWLWRGGDVVTMSLNVGPFLLRAAFLAEAGFGGRRKTA